MTLTGISMIVTPACSRTGAAAGAAAPGGRTAAARSTAIRAPRRILIRTPRVSPLPHARAAHSGRERRGRGPNTSRAGRRRGDSIRARAEMIDDLRDAYNADFSDERDHAYERRLSERGGMEIPFRLAETPVFLPTALREEMVSA